MKRKNTSRIGKREEREIVKDLEARGYRCRRQPGSGNRDFTLQHDVWWESPIGAIHIEDKYREKSQWQRLEGYRGGAEILTLRCDGRHADQNGERMVFMPWSTFLTLMGDAQERMGEEAPEPRDGRQVWERGLGKPKIPQRANPWPKGRKIPSRKDLKGQPT